MDKLILTPYFIAIVEVKNIAGEVFFDLDFHQLIRKINGIEESYQCPILQVNLQTTQFKAWLVKNKLPNIPIYSIVVFSNPSTIIKTDPKHKPIVKEMVIHAGYFPQMMQTQFNTYRTEIIPSKDVKKLARIIMKQNTPLNPDILKQFEIDKSEILTGVQCSTCKVLGAGRINGVWHCFRCKAENKDAHIEALQDYSLLLAPTITNRELRNFLHIPSISVANKLLAALHLKYSGDRRGRKYELPNIEDWINRC